METRIVCLFVVLTLCSQGRAEFTPISHGCDQRSCYPATGNLLIGREDKLTASDTCGLEGKNRYCIISSLDPHTRGGDLNRNEKCYWCDASSKEEAHNVSSIVHRWEPHDATPRSRQRMTWWQGPNGQENITVQLNLEAEFHVTHIIITFKSFRPAAMYIEKSFDWGKTWKIHRYFSSDCSRDFPNIPKGVPRSLEEIVCQERYSRISPSTKGEVIYRVLPPNININSPKFNPYSQEVQDLLKTTNLRVSFTRLHKLGDESLDMNPVDIKEKYYYSVYDMIVRGSCSCYGHAQRCLPERDEHKDILGMVHGTCECSHNTKGNNCEQCLDFYHDMPWNPAKGKQKNECKKCNCNDHSSKCHFDEAVWEATGHTSGGVCEECQHNTEGRQCDSCISGYYQTTSVPMNHPEVCLECDCEPDGTNNGGICDGRTDKSSQMVAGQCHCKTYAGGPRCDRCKEGYWNFTASNPDACQQCTCNPLGTINVEGCHQRTGECRCKRNVIGRDCDQCRPEHFGLSNDVNGCTPCDCDPGGSFDNNCEVTTGQCSCRPNIKGRRCDQVKDFYYTGPLDYLLFEGELAHGSELPPTKVTKKKPSNIAGETTWTGSGYMLVFEGSQLTFDIPEIHRTMNYRPVVRYAHLPTHPDTWDAVGMQLIRIDGPADPSGKCSGADDGPLPVSLPAGGISVEAPLPFCLEVGQRYQVKLVFNRYDPVQPSQANIYIDAIALLPVIDDIPFLNPTWEDPVNMINRLCPDDEEMVEDGGQASLVESNANCQHLKQLSADRMSTGWSPGPERATELREQFDRLGCASHFSIAQSAREAEMPKDCENILYSISFFAFEGAFDRACECSNTGSLSKACDTYYGGCECKSLVVGRRCDSCAPASYGFSSQGCRRCECHFQGSQDEFCNQETGQCNCHNNAYGRKCDECKPGYWNFPNCQQCQCNGHAFACDPHHGECFDCRDETTGSFCERCKIGYYGNPMLGPDQIPCRPCPCPDVKSTGHSYAESCYLDESTSLPVCDCSPGYGGERCDVCADNYFGNPEMPGGECRMCNCSGNWQESESGNCDPHTGRCEKCLYSTEGFNCESCMAGYFGDAVGDMCKECTCNMLGTDPNRFDCDRRTGECTCLPNVEGSQCDRCKPNHWKIASGEGCEACDCDPVGSTGETCDLYIGQCNCKQGFGGRKCDQCESNFWGDPKVECNPCNCNHQGVDPDRAQCHRETGTCFCLEGISGQKCDQCARGFLQYHHLTPERPVMSRTIPVGAMPDCQKCGECFDNWDRILSGLKNETNEKVVQAEKVKVTGAAGAYTRIFENMESKIDTVKDIIHSTSISVDELVKYKSDIARMTERLNNTTAGMKSLDNGLADTKQSFLRGQYNLTNLRREADRLQNSASDVRSEATQLQESNVKGALVLTQQAKIRSDRARDKVDKINTDRSSPFAKSRMQREATERLMAVKSDQIETEQVNNTNQLQQISRQIDALQDQLPSLNRAVCDGDTSREQPCDELCGGAGCGKCGGLSCQQGAFTKAQEAKQNAHNAEKIFAEKDLQAESVLNSVSAVYWEVAGSEENAQVAFDTAYDAKTRAMNELDEVNTLNAKIDEFLDDDKATPDQVKSVAYECLNATMTMDTTQIQLLAEEINNAIDSVTDVDKINAETAEPLARAEQLKREADLARQDAAQKLDTAQNVVKSLTDSEQAQAVSETAIASAQADIAAARRHLGKIETEMDQATMLSAETFDRTNALLEEQKALQTIYIANENHVNSAQEAATLAKKKANQANRNLYKLSNDLNKISSSLEQKSDKIGSAKDRALDLQRRANNLAHSASSKLANLQDTEKEYEENKRQLDVLSAQLVQLNCQMQMHLMVIESKSNFYRTCSSPSVWQHPQSCECHPDQDSPTCSE